MNSKRKPFWFAAGAALLLVTAGCGGINATHSISPASFFLPGLLKTEPTPAPADATLPEATAVQQVAQVR